MTIGDMQLELPRTWAQARPLLRSILRPATYGSLVHAGQPLAWRQPLSTFLHELVAIDLPTSRVIVTANHVEDWAVSAVDVFVAARENIATMHPLDRNAPGTEGTFVDADQSSYIAAAILTPGWLASFARPDGPRPVAFVPTEDTLIICTDDPDEAPKYFETAEQMYCEAERRGSPEAFTVSAGQVVPFDKAGPHP